MTEPYKALGISDAVLTFGEKVLAGLTERFSQIDAISEANQMKVIAAMQKNRLAANHFNLSSGYGYDDEGRDNLERVYADCFGTEAALVRPQITCGTHALALALGVACAVTVHWKIPVLRQIVGGYIELFRNTPLLVQLFFLYFALPKIGIRISAETCGKLGLGLLGGAYMAETFRSGLENIPIIQTESAQSLGLRPAQVFGYVILPQAVTSSVPGLLANLIFLLKETSVFSTISLMDLMFTAKDLIGMYAKTIECLTMLVAFYLVMLLPVSVLGSWLERRLRYAEFGN